ncbi:MAG TPA: hypothetical protein VK718_05970 [Ferruginibacter sp.]|nr:hypothetical protein [Ferruginibacter sp.]
MTKDNRINVLNIGLMLFSCVAAFIMPFEVFLFAYAVMGPLHYLTEISWLHDRKYFAKGKYDYVVLLVIGVLITLQALAYQTHYVDYLIKEYDWDADSIPFIFKNDFYNKIMFVAFFGAILMAFVENVFFKVFGLLFILIIANYIFLPNSEDNLTFFLAALLPTLVHVYIFTGFFILYGALKSRSQSGLLSFFVFVCCPLLLFYLFRDESFVHITNYGKDAYVGKGEGFAGLNKDILGKFFHVDFPAEKDGSEFGANTSNILFNSKLGILLMRFIAFAYTYHYLNWFSKTEVIRWHKVPKARFVVVIVLWVASLAIYAIDYAKGLEWLFFLSFCHVLLEFPLNYTSVAGIFRELGHISKNGFKAGVAPAK